MKVLYFLKGLLSIFPLLFFLLVASYILFKYKKIRSARFTLGFAILIFLITSTGYLPGYFANRLETKYPVYHLPQGQDTTRTFILVLGSGYTLDKRLPANSQLGNAALARLVEGIRVHKMLPQSIIITSGYAPDGNETQAQVTKRAALLLGIDAGNVATLDNPKTTQDEAAELKRIFGINLKLIIVTDAIHMPRAMQIFSQAGYNPTAAPTNFKMTVDAYTGSMKFIPSFGNIGLMNYVIHEWLGSLKASLQK